MSADRRSFISVGKARELTGFKQQGRTAWLDSACRPSRGSFPCSEQMRWKRFQLKNYLSAFSKRMGVSHPPRARFPDPTCRATFRTSAAP